MSHDLPEFYGVSTAGAPAFSAVGTVTQVSANGALGRPKATVNDSVRMTLPGVGLRGGRLRADSWRLSCCLTQRTVDGDEFWCSVFFRFTCFTVRFYWPV